jgi:hypothetical protein
LELYFFCNHFGETQPIAIAKRYPLLPKRSSTVNFAEKQKNGEAMIIDGLIECVVHPHLDYTISDNGWGIDEVVLNIDKKEFQFDAALFGTPEIVSQDNKRYVLVSVETVLADQSCRLVLKVSPTRWSKTKQAKNLIFGSDDARHNLLSIDPSMSKVPNPFGLHAILLFSDRSVLALRRRDDLEYWPSHFSVSFEEQMGEEDTHAGPNRLKAWFRRALCEEVFPLTGPAKSDEAISAWQHVESFVKSTRVWSVVLEEPSASFALFGVIELNLSPSEFRIEYERIREELGTRRDNEGKLFSLSRDELKNLVLNRMAKGKSIFDDEEVLIAKLHPTSLYRAACIDAVIDREQK